MDIKNTIKLLTDAKGVSGAENATCGVALDMLRKYCTDAAIINGNVIGNLSEFKKDRKHLLLDAHIDQVGMIVTCITDDGFIKVGNVGGIDRRLLPAQQVTIHGKQDIKGVICSVPPHLSSGTQEVLKMTEVSIDAGMKKSELEKIVSHGDVISFDTSYSQLLGTRITAPSLDDRCGVASILYALELLSDSDTESKYNVTVLFSSQEELGERGARIAAFEINPDIAIAVDVSFGYADGETEYECGKLGKGAMIGISPSLSREISDELVETSKACNIPYQLEIMNGLTSTNADRFAVNRCGSKACTVSIPLRYMHTPVEVIDVEDVRMTAELLAAYIRGEVRK